MSNILGIAHVAIQAEDFNKVILFYTKALDFNIIHEWSLPEFHLKNAAMLKSPDGKSMIEIFDNEADIAGQGRRRRAGEEFIKGSLLHFAINVKDIKLAFEKAISYGAKEYIKPSKVILGDKSKVVENALVYSPNGEVIEFIKESIF